MDEQELKRKVQLLYGIKPREDWVVLTKTRVFSDAEEVGHRILSKRRFWATIADAGKAFIAYVERPAFVMPVLAFLVAGGAVWQGASESLPGDALYPVKATAEQVPLQFTLGEEQPMREFVLATQRLADLKVVAEQNKVKNLPSAIQEFEENALKVSEDFVAIVENQPEQALRASKQVVQLQKEKSEVERILGTKIGAEHDQDIENAITVLVQYELEYLTTRSLVREQEILLENAKEAAEEGMYTEALEIIWQLSQGL